MSLSSIATNIYTIQSKRKVPLKTAFSMMVREDLAMRFSVYNLVKTVTKSDLLATVAQTAYGKRTPMQQKQDREEIQKEKTDKKFKQFTVGSIATLNKRLNLLQTVTEQNSAMITAIYKDIGYFKGQRKIEPFTTRATRIPIASKSIKGKIDEINDQLRKLSKLGKKPFVPKKTKVQEKKEKKEDEKNFIESFIPFLLRNPRLAMLAAGGTGAALSLGSFLMQGYSLFNLQKSGSRILDRFQGKPGFEDELTETISRGVDTGVATIGAGTVAGVATAGAAYMRRKRIAKATKADADTARIKSIQTQTERLKKVGVNYKTAQKIAGKSNKIFNTIAKWKFVNSAFKGIAKRLPALAAADVAFELSRMSGYVADRDSNKVTEQEFKKKMVSSYAELISTVGIGGLSTVAGSLAGTALFPGIGTLGGATVGAVFGGLASLWVDEQDMLGVAEKVYSMLHEDKSFFSREKETTNTASMRSDSGGRRTANIPEGITSSTSVQGSQKIELKDKSGKVIEVREGGNINWRNNNPGNIRYGDYAVSKGAIGENGGFAIFPTIEVGRKAADDLLSTGKNYKNLNIAQAIARWAPSEDNNDPVKYAATIAKLTGVDVNKKYADLSRAEKDRVLDAMTRIEGGKTGRVYRGEQIQRVSAIPSVITPPPIPVPVSNNVSAPPTMPQSNTADKKSDVSEQTEIRSVASLGAIELMNKNINNRLSNIEQRIIGIEKLRPQEFPFIEDPNFFS